jgi:hypothetical protein
MQSRGDIAVGAQLAAVILDAARGGPLLARHLCSRIAPGCAHATFHKALRRLLEHGCLQEHKIVGKRYYIGTGKPAPEFRTVKQALAEQKEMGKAKQNELLAAYASGITGVKALARACQCAPRSVYKHLGPLGLLKPRDVKPKVSNISDKTLRANIKQAHRKKVLEFAPSQPKPRRDPVARYVAEWRRMRRASRANAA